MSSKLLVYGATEFVGALIAPQRSAPASQTILAGRDRAKLDPLAANSGPSAFRQTSLLQGKAPEDDS